MSEKKEGTKKKVGIQEKEPEVKAKTKAPAPLESLDDGDRRLPQEVVTEDDVMVAGLIGAAGVVDEDEWEKMFLDIKSRGNYFDLVRNMFPFRLPEACTQMQKNEERRYGWIGKDNMESKCDPSIFIYWTPVNRTNHPMLPRTSFNRHGGVCRESMYLCYMPWKMYAARKELQSEMSRIKYEDVGAVPHDKEAEGVAHYKPDPGPGGATVMREGDITHRGREAEGIEEEAFVESGEYE